MKRKTSVDVRVFQSAVFNHQFVAGVAFFAGLKTENERAGDLTAAARKIFRRAQQNSNMRVMPARMHGSGILRTVLNVGRLFNRERIDVRSQQRYRTGFTSVQYSQNAGLPDAGSQIVKVKRFKFTGNVCRRFELFHGKLGMHVKVPAMTNELVHGNRRVADHLPGFRDPYFASLFEGAGTSGKSPYTYLLLKKVSGSGYGRTVALYS